MGCHSSFQHGLDSSIITYLVLLKILCRCILPYCNAIYADCILIVLVLHFMQMHFENFYADAFLHVLRHLDVPPSSTQDRSTPTCCLWLQLRHCDSASAAAARCATPGWRWSRWSRANWHHTGSLPPANNNSSSSSSSQSSPKKHSKETMRGRPPNARAAAQKKFRAKTPTQRAAWRSHPMHATHPHVQ